MMELLIVIVLAGILAVVVLPRLNPSQYRSAQFHAQVVSALRYAQKTATSHRRLVCVTFPTVSSLQLNIATAYGAGACDAALSIPGSNGNTISSPDATNVVFSSCAVAFNFQSDGTGANRSIVISGENAIVVAGATGYVK